VIIFYSNQKNNKPATNSDGLINCLRQPGQPHYQHPKSMVLNESQLIKSSGTRTDPAAETESIGLPAYAQLSQVFAEPLRQFYRDPRLTAVNRDSSIYQDSPIWKLSLDQQAIVHQPGLSHLDSYVWTTKLSAIYRDFIWTKKLRPSTGIVQKLMPARAADGNSIKPPGR
jgi:hypothetical protein